MKNEATSSAAAGRRRSARRQQGEAQLDFPLTADPTPPRRSAEVGSRPCSRERARWWFDRMRQVVDEGRTVETAGVF